MQFSATQNSFAYWNDKSIAEIDISIRLVKYKYSQ